MNTTLAEKRNYPRIDMDELIEMQVRGESTFVRVTDLSAGGASIKVEGPLSSGRQVTLVFDKGRVLGLTTRNVNGSVGVRFVRPTSRRKLIG